MTDTHRGVSVHSFTIFTTERRDPGLYKAKQGSILIAHVVCYSPENLANMILVSGDFFEREMHSP